MKKQTFSYTISIIILITLAIASSFVLRPILATVVEEFERIQKHYITLLRNNTGLDVSYEALSPSIFAGIRMSNIELSDVQSGESLIFIDSIKLKWNIFKLFGENPSDALGELLISGLNADYDHLQNYEVVEKFFTFIQSLDSSPLLEEPAISNLPIPSDDGDLTQTEIRDALQVLFSIPINIRIKNTSLAYSNSNIDAELFLFDIKIRARDQTGHLNLSMDGKTSLSVQGIDSSPKTFAAGFSLQGSLLPELENSFAQMRISSLKQSNYTVPRLDVHSTYANNTIEAYIMQNNLPFTLSIFLDMVSKNFEVDFRAEELDPFELLIFQNENDLVSKLEDLTVSGAYKLAYNWNTGEIAYNADGSANVPPNLLGEAIALDFSFEGDTDIILIDHIDIDSNAVSANYEGSFDLQNLLPQGFVDVRSVKLPSGNSVSTEIYIDSFDNEMLFFMPQIYFGERSLTALQLNAQLNDASIDFTFEVSDYSRIEDSEPGVLGVNGSFVFDEQKFLQLQISAESLFIDSVMEIALWCLPEERTTLLTSAIPSFAPYIFSFDLFFSTDFQTLSYNLPYAIIANTQKDDELLLFSLDGSESVSQLSNLDMLAGGQSIQAEASADLGDGKSEIFFGFSLFVNSFPYTFSGVFMPNEYLNVSGDYDFRIAINFFDDAILSGSAQTHSFPISISKFLFSLSFETDFTYNSVQDWFVQANLFEVSEISGTMPVHPRISLTGKIDRYDAFFSDVVYSDELSSLQGALAVSWNIDGGIIENVTLNAELEDRFSSEKYALNIEAFNPSHFAFNDAQFFDNMYFSADALIQASPSGRFANFQTEENNINASFTALGTLENPSINLIVDNSSILMGASNTMFNGNLVLENKVITATNINVQYQGMTFSNLGGNLFLEEMNGTFNGFFDGGLATTGVFKNKTFSSPIKLSIEPLGNNTDLPFSENSFKIDLVFEELVGSFFPTMKNYKVEVIRTPGRFDLNAGLNGELSGYFLETGEISLSATEGFFVLFDAFGIIENNEIALFIDNIFTDARSFSGLLDLSVFSLHSGTVVGSGTLTGDLLDPQINAEFFGTDVEVSIPDYVDERLICADFRVTTSQNIFSVVDGYFIAQESGAEVNLTVDLALEQLLFSYLRLDIKTLNDTLVAGKYAIPHGTFAGQAGVELQIQLDNDLVEVIGNINTEDVEAIITVVPENMPLVDGSDDLDVVVDLIISVGSQAHLFIPSKTNPFIRGLVNQQEPLIIQMDTRYGTSLFTGDFTMRGGEILYFNRTFFVRDARVVINENIDSFDPLITASAEIRERDEEGDPIRIMLSVINQPLSQLNPTFTSIPTRNEQEIMTLLGQRFIGDTLQNPLTIIGTLADYGAQITVLNNVEDQIRDFLNFDIFSIQSRFLQNAFTIAIGFDEGINQLNFGNLVDNTTVYIGKFLNDTLYFDMLLHLAYDEEQKNEEFFGYVFQPEFGLEFPSPFATIRWSIAPDFTADWSLAVPSVVKSTSISFSWKFDL